VDINGNIRMKNKGSKKDKLTFVDLFAGAGGFSEGFYLNDFESLLHVDFDKSSCETLSKRMSHFDYTQSEIQNGVLCGDMTKKTTNNEISNRTSLKGEVDVLVGGPPCQSFSSVGRAQDPNSMKNDPRNYLFLNYLDTLNLLKPKVFVFENVSGLLSAKPNGEYIFPDIIKRMSKHYDVCDEKEIILLNSVHYGVPQIRKRVILIGVRKDLRFKSKDVYSSILKTNYSPDDLSISKLNKYFTVRDAIYDLPKLKPDQEFDELLKFKPKLNDYLKLIRNPNYTKIHNHSARKHNENDIERYYHLSKNNWQLKDLEKVRPDLVHHDPKHFGNRYTVQEWDKPGKTVVAHLYKDGNLFIHPDYKQSRTFTVREAARIQSFPDNFIFCGSRTDQFKQVGNAVPPMMASQIAKAIKKFL